MGYSTRVLSKEDDFPSFEELSSLIRTEHPGCNLTTEEGDEDEGGEGEWQTLLLSMEDGVEIALIERHPVFDGSAGQDDIADLIEETRDCKPTSGVEWLHEFLDEVKTVYTFEHLTGDGLEEGSAALHALRSFFWSRGNAIIQADLEGFTNEEGHHIVWQFSDTVSGPWSMAVLQEGSWHHFDMDLGDLTHRAAFLRGEVPPDVSSVRLS